MARTIILVPMMYSREDLKKILGLVPDDFEATSLKFWGYVEEKLKPFVGRIHVIYSEKHDNKDPNSQLDSILKELINNHAELQCIEDPLLAAEAEAWRELMKSSQNQAVSELFEESMTERNDHAKGVIERTLGENQMGILFMDPTRKVSLPDDVKVIRMCPFDPIDYLNRHLVKLKTAKKE